MKEIILIILIGGLFIFFFWFLLAMVKKPKKKTEEKPEEKEEKKEETKQEIPEILKEVTMGNYMHDISTVPDSSDGLIMQETEIETEEEIKPIFDIEKEFDYIENQGNEISAMFDEDIDDAIDEIEDIEDDVDDYVKDMMEDDEDEAGGQQLVSVADEIKNSSNNLKALLIANILDKKQK